MPGRFDSTALSPALAHWPFMPLGPALTRALLFGSLEGLPPSVTFLYARTGLIHLFSASGFHMAAAILLGGAAGRVLSPYLPARWRAAVGCALSLALMTFFGHATEWSSPLVRAYAFTGLYSLAQAFERKPNRPWVFALSLAAAFVLGRGSALSFFLSATGMAGVLAFRKSGAMALAIGPWIFTLPLTIWAFGLFSLDAPLWNLTFGTLVSLLVMPPAIAALVLDALGLPTGLLWRWSEAAMGLLHEGLAAGEAWIGHAYWVPFLPFALGALLLGAGIAFLSTENGKNKGPAQTTQPPMRAISKGTIGAWALLVVGGLIPLACPRPSLALLQVGQGDALLLELSSGRWLVDAGPPSKKGDALVSRALEKLGIGDIDHLLLTHADRDHIGGAPSLLARHKIKYIWLNQETQRDERTQPLLAMAAKLGVQIRQIEEGPPGLRCWLPPFSGNEASPLCHGATAAGSVWLTGDGGFSAERWLLAQGKIPKADFLKVGHHGSHFSSSTAFLEATGAHTALIGVGRNRYGHPHGQALTRLRDAGMRIVRSDQGGWAAYRFWPRAAGVEARARPGAKSGTPAEAKRP